MEYTGTSSASMDFTMSVQIAVHERLGWPYASMEDNKSLAIPATLCHYDEQDMHLHLIIEHSLLYIILLYTSN